MDSTQKLFVAWVVICLAILGTSIFSLVLSLRNRRDINQLKQ